MTENRHPLEDQARALVDDNRFLRIGLMLSMRCAAVGRTAITRHAVGLNSSVRWRAWGARQQSRKPLGHSDQIARRFAVWDRNQELEL